MEWLEVPSVFEKAIRSRKDIAAIRITPRGSIEDLANAFFRKVEPSGDNLYTFSVAAHWRKFKVELKKQQGVQWFDVDRFFDDEADDWAQGIEDILMVFVTYSTTSGEIENVSAICLPELIRLLGWDRKTMRKALRLRRKVKGLQFKVPVTMRALMKGNTPPFQLLYSADPAAHFDMEPRTFLKRLPPESRALLDVARPIVQAALPNANERVYEGFRTLSYGKSAALDDQVISLTPVKGRLQIAFRRGAELPDPMGLLEAGKGQERIIRIKRADQLEAPALRDLLQAAAAPPPESETP